MMIPAADRRRAFKLDLILPMEEVGGAKRSPFFFWLKKLEIQENANERNVQLAG